MNNVLFLPFPGGNRPLTALRQRATELRVEAALDEPLGALFLANPPNLAHSARALFRQIVKARPETLVSELLDAEMNAGTPVAKACSAFANWPLLDQACRAYFKWLSREPYYTNPDARRASPPPTSRPALHDWAQAHQVVKQLQQSFIALVDFSEPRLLSDLYSRKGPAPSVEVLASPQPGERAIDPAMVQAARSWLWANAILERRSTERFRLRALAWAVPPRHLALQDLAARIARQMREARDAWPADRVACEGALLIADLKAQWTAPDHAAHVVVNLEAPRGEPVLVSCDCCALPKHCFHRLNALEALLDLLHSDGEQAAALARALAAPAWSKVLQDLDKALSGPSSATASSSAPAPAEQLAFRITIGAGTLRLGAYAQRPLKRGGWSPGQRTGWHSLERFDFPHKAAVRALLQRSYFGYGPDDGTSFDALELLSGYPHLYLEDDLSAPVTVRRGVIGLAVTRAPDGSYRIAPTIDGDAALGSALLARAGHGARQAIADKAKHECVLVSLSGELAAVMAALARRTAAFPPEAVGELLQRLELLEKQAPMTLAPELEGEPVEPDRRLVLRLSPMPEGGLVVEALVRPLPEGSAVAPGEGPARLSAFRDGKRVHVARDFLAEVARARELLAALPLPAPLDEPWRFQLQGEPALDLLSAVERAAGQDLVAEWPRDAHKIHVTRQAGPECLKVSIERQKDWFGLSGEVQIDGERVALALLLDAARRGRRYVEVGPGRFLALSEELRSRAARAADVVHAGRSGLEASLAAASALDDLLDSAGELSLCDEWRRTVSRMKAARSFEPSLPAQLTADLRPYQAEGYQWLARLAEWGVGACLADDMGLGKTVQALAVLLARAERGPALVVAPTSVCFNWVREAERFAPSLRPVLFREGDRAATLAALGPSDLLVCSWGLLVGHAEPLAKVRFATLVLDEAQAIKNPATRRARAARDLSTEWRVALSGTPLENHLGELWSLFRVVAPGLLGSWESFRERFASPIERDRNPERLAALSRVVRPFILRRTKDQVAKELPARTEVRQLVTLSAPERQLYDDARIAAVARLAEEGGGSDQQKRFEVLAALTRLRQLACHPKLYDPASSVPSSKLSRFMEIVAELKDNGHRALVFSQFTSHLALVREALDEKGVTYLYLDGQTPVPERVRRVDAFQAGQADLFLISLKAGGTGLNLTAADYVVHLDPWWNPSVEDQATDRAHRIGQVRPVTVYRLVSKGTIEEAILALHEEKRDLVAGVLDGAGTAAKLTNVELIALIRAGEGAPDVERGEEPDEDESNDEAELQASEAVAGGSPPAPAGDLPANPLRWIADDFRAWLRVHAPGSSIVKAYPRAIERFLGFAHQKLGAAASDARLPLVLGLADAYRDALESGAFPAPKSEPIAVHSALGKLRQFAEEDGDDAGP